MPGLARKALASARRRIHSLQERCAADWLSRAGRKGDAALAAGHSGAFEGSKSRKIWHRLKRPLRNTSISPEELEETRAALLEHRKIAVQEAQSRANLTALEESIEKVEELAGNFERAVSAMASYPSVAHSLDLEHVKTHLETLTRLLEELEAQKEGLIRRLDNCEDQKRRQQERMVLTMDNLLVGHGRVSPSNNSEPQASAKIVEYLSTADEIASRVPVPDFESAIWNELVPAADEGDRNQDNAQGASESSPAEEVMHRYRVKKAYLNQAQADFDMKDGYLEQEREDQWRNMSAFSDTDEQ